jgi:microcystin-dependent protein
MYNSFLIFIILILLCVNVFLKIFFLDENSSKLNEHFTEEESIQKNIIESVASTYNNANYTTKNATVDDVTIIGSLNLLPKGIVVAWTQVDAPYGWVICDGTNGTPDLRNRFIIGASSTRQINTKFGSETHKLLADEMPNHTHTYDGKKKIVNADAGRERELLWTRGGTDIKNNLIPDNDVSTSATGSSSTLPFGTMPPYFVLVYIMKI